MKRSILTALICFTLATPAMAADKTDLTVGVNTWFGNGPVFVAKEKNFYNGTSVDVKVIDDVTAMVNAFRAGQLDIVCMTSDAAALQYANGMTGKVIVTTDYSAGSDGVIAQSAIKTPADLKGKSIGFTRGFASEYLLGRVLKDAGLTMNDIKQVPFDDPGLAAQGLFSGKVDAAVTWEPFLTQATSKNLGSVIKDTRAYPGILPNVFVVSEKTLKDHPDAVRNFIRGVVKGLAFETAEPEAYVAITAKGFNTPEADVAESLKGIHLQDKKSNAEFLCSKKPAFLTDFNQAAQFWFDQKLISQKPKDGTEYISKIGCDLFKVEAK